MSKIKIIKKLYKKVCKDALNEDLYPNGDITSKLLKNNKKKSKINIKSSRNYWWIRI